MKTALRSSWLTGLGVVLLVFSSCRKENPTASPQVTPPVVTPTPTGLVLQDRAVLLDTVKYHLTSTAAQLAAGTYQFRYTGTLPDFKAGDILIGAQGKGLLRKVGAVSIQANQVNFQTTQATMEDAFKNGTLDLGADMNGLNRGTATNSWSFALANQSLYNNGPLSVVLRSGQIDLNPNWDLGLEFVPTGIKHFVMAARGGNLNGSFTVSTTATQAVTLVKQTSTLKHVSKTYTKWVPATIGVIPVVVPITVEMDLDLTLEYSVSLDAAITREATFTSSNTFDLGVEYLNSTWQGIYAFSPTNTFVLGPRSGNANGTLTMALIPRISFKLYGVAGPNAAVGLQEELKAGVASPALDWDFKADVWLHPSVGADVTILGKTLASYTKSWDTPKLNYTTPDRLVRTSGDNQTGTASQTLAQPIRVQVLDSKGNSQSNVPVYFTPVAGNGSASPSSILSDANGYAESRWTLGASTTTIQHANVTVKTSAGQNIRNAPIDFAATGSSSPYCEGIPFQFDSLHVNLGARGPQYRYFELVPFTRGGVAPFSRSWSTPGSTGAIVCVPAQSAQSGGIPCSYFNGTNVGLGGSICRGTSVVWNYTITDARGASQTKSVTVSY